MFWGKDMCGRKVKRARRMKGIGYRFLYVLVFSSVLQGAAYVDILAAARMSMPALL